MAIPSVINQWHKLVKTRDVSILDQILDEQAVLLSPVVHSPQKGKAITRLYLMGAIATLGNEQFRYVREVYGDGFAVLEFETQIDGKYVNGVDMISWNSSSLITEFKVMIRPLQGVNAVHKVMAEALERLKI